MNKDKVDELCERLESVSFLDFLRMIFVLISKVASWALVLILALSFLIILVHGLIAFVFISFGIVVHFFNIFGIYF